MLNVKKNRYFNIYLPRKPKSVISPTFIFFFASSGLFMPYQHFFRHLVHIPVSP